MVPKTYSGWDYYFKKRGENGELSTTVDFKCRSHIF